LTLTGGTRTNDAVIDGDALPCQIAAVGSEVMSRKRLRGCFFMAVAIIHN